MFKTIVLTWIDQRVYLPSYGKPIAALWLARGRDTDIRNAVDYAATRGGMQVHTFDPDDSEWASKASAAHPAIAR